MPWNLKDFTILFSFGATILIIGFLVISYANSNIESFQFQLQQSGLTLVQRATLQANLNSWQIDKITLLEPFSHVVMIVGSIIMVFSVIYSVLAIYRPRLERSKQEIVEKASINEKPTNRSENNVEVIPDSSNTMLMKDNQGPKMKNKFEDEVLEKATLTVQSDGVKTSEERELLVGKLAGLFNNPSVILTSERLIFGDRSIDLSEIIEVYPAQKRLQSELVVRLANGTTERLDISPEKSVSVLTFLSGSLDAQESEMRAGSKATVDRWVNAINQQLRQKTENQTETFEERIKELEKKLKENEKK